MTGTVTKHHTTVVQGRRLRDDDDGEQALIMMGQFKLSLTKAKAVRTKDEIRCSFIVMTIYVMLALGVIRVCLPKMKSTVQTK